MFLRRMGRKILVLHSYRDGTGRVCQRRLAHFDSAEEAAERLADPAWRDQLGQRYPELPGHPERLIAKLSDLSSQPVKRIIPPRGPEQKLQTALRTVQRLIQENPGLKGQVALALLDLSALETPALPERRSCWDARDPDGASLRATLEERALVSELAAGFPCEETWLAYGESLQRLGRWDEALTQYARLSPRGSLRHYQMASVLIAQGKEREGLHHLALGMNRERSIAEALLHIEKGGQPLKGAEYWERYGYLWEAPARKFFLNVYRQSVVKMTLARHHGVRRRRVFSEPATRVVLEQARDGVTHRLIQPGRPLSEATLRQCGFPSLET